MKKVKVTYNGGGKVKKNKTKIIQKAGEKTAEGDTKIGLWNSPIMKKVSPQNQAVEGKDRTEGIKEANVKIAAVLEQLRALSPAEAKGEKGKALKNQLRILRDSKRGRAAGDSSVAMNKKGEVYKA
jgi:hypothetical protein